MTRQITTINPATEQVIGTYEMMTREQKKEKTMKVESNTWIWKRVVNIKSIRFYDELVHQHCVE